MTTVSIPLSDNLMQGVKRLIELDQGANVSDVVRTALKKYLEDKAVEMILKAEAEPTLEGDLDDLLQKI